MPKIMPADREGICLKCLGPIEIGEQIAYAREFGAMHVGCPEDVIVEEFYGYINMSPGKDTKDDWCIRVIHPDGAGDREGEEVQILTSRGNLKTEVLGEAVMVYEPRHAVYRKAPEAPNDEPVTQPGIYEMPSGEVYRVKYNKAQTNLYAQKLIEINPERALQEGGRVNIEFEYAAGAVRRLKSSQKMSYEKAKELTIRYGRCIVCGRRLKAAQSVEEGIGPVCRKSFTGYANYNRPRQPDETDEIQLPMFTLTDEQIDAMDVDELEAMIAKLKAFEASPWPPA
jgi:hypothetical protein